jgi:hypothetical protein
MINNNKSTHILLALLLAVWLPQAKALPDGQRKTRSPDQEKSI